MRLGQAGHAEHHQHVRGLLPKRALLPMLLFPDVEPVVSDEHDDGVVLIGGVVQGIQNPPDLGIRIARAGQIALDGILPLVMSGNFAERAFMSQLLA